MKKQASLAPALGRRTLLASAAAMAALAGGARSSFAVSGGITFGSITPNTGTYGFAGKLITNGSQLAIDMAGDSILGKPIRYLSRDDGGSAATGVRELSAAISSDGLSVFNGNYSSAVGLAELAVAKREKVLQYAAGGSEDFTGSRCSRYTFQWSASPYTALKAVMDYLVQAHPNAKRIYTITSDYTFGQTLLRYAQIVGKTKGLEFVGNAMVPLGAQQYAQFLTPALAAKPDIVCLLNSGEDSILCLRQLASFGAKNLVVMAPWSIEVEQLPELSPEIREGLILGENYVPFVDTPVNKDFVPAYRKKYGATPGYASAYGYDSFRTVLMAMKNANSVEIPKVIAAMEGMAFDGLLGKTSISADTHQTVRPYYVVRGRATASPGTTDVFADLVHTGDDDQPQALNACKGLGPV